MSEQPTWLDAARKITKRPWKSLLIVTVLAVFLGIVGFYMRPGLPPAKWGFTGGGEVLLALTVGTFGLRTKHERDSKSRRA